MTVRLSFRRAFIAWALWLAGGLEGAQRIHDSRFARWLRRVTGVGEFARGRDRAGAQPRNRKGTKAEPDELDRDVPRGVP
jgi:hypothetical protein